MGLGVSIPSTKTNHIFKRFKQIFENELSFQEYKYFIARISVVDEEESVKIAKKHYKDTFIVECKYPMSELSEMLMKERVEIYSQILLRAIYKFYEHHDQDFNEIDIIKTRLVEEGIILN